MATITLSIDEALLRRAEQVASSRGMSVEKYLDRLLHVVTQPPPKENELSPLIRKCIGILPPLTDEEIEQTLAEHRLHKYGYGLDGYQGPKE